MRALIGAWELVAYEDVDEEGSHHEGPLGPAPRGLLIYSADGRVSVTMMRTVNPSAPSGRDWEVQAYASYAGTWRHANERVYHTITVAPDPGWLGTEQARDVTLDGERLTLTGRSLARPAQSRILEWRRVAPAG
jgi:hypothetical protein